ncbi:toxin CcdB [Parvibaculum indicum]|uniref:CcdB family protein n=1 Tax=Parvibaculum indicum TaxID=562969 RepID=UPI00141DB07A|nr:CcdB family protein [Parvibaculum indicum]NIJ40753.1 toxin CcdB [Parvibaculum indicum]
MAQFDVYRNRHSSSRDEIPFFLLLQHDVIETRALRVVAPLVPLSRAELPMTRLNPVFEAEGQKLILSTLEIAGVSASFLGDDIVTSFADRRDDIIAAVDFLMTGI